MKKPKEKRKITSEELETRLNFVEDVNKFFPFLVGNYRVVSSVQLNDKGEEMGTLGLEIFSSTVNSKRLTIQLLSTKHLKKVISGALKTQNDKLRKENKELKLKIKELEKNENTLQQRKNKVDSKNATSSNDRSS